jgi:leucyl/phenylalanyl-tRNA--protein transferase
VFLLASDSLHFPDPQRANSEGLLALGGDLSVPRLLLAYRSGIFPWTDDPISWWSPNPRAIFELNSFQPSRRLADKIKKQTFRITFDQAFSQVIAQCAAAHPNRLDTWISPAFISAYLALHRAGQAHSAEAWDGDQLVGGVYGVAIGAFFAGESMFHRATDASKIALCALFARLQSKGFTLFDTQVVSPLTKSLGAIEIRRAEYLRRLSVAVNQPEAW